MHTFVDITWVLLLLYCRAKVVCRSFQKTSAFYSFVSFFYYYYLRPFSGCVKYSYSASFWMLSARKMRTKRLFRFENNVRGYLQWKLGQANIFFLLRKRYNNSNNSGFIKMSNFLSTYDLIPNQFAFDRTNLDISEKKMCINNYII